MQQETIVHFLCFITNMNAEEFAKEWLGFARTLKIGKAKVTVYKQKNGDKDNYGYIAKFELPKEDFQLPHIQERKPGRYSDSRIRIQSIGGYLAVQQDPVYNERNFNTTIIAFIHHNETDIASYYELPFYSQLSIHKAYYESSNYGYIMEFIVPEDDAETLLELVMQKPHATAGMYNETYVSKSSKPLVAVL